MWSTRIAPTLATLGLLGCLWLVLANFTLITGGSFSLSLVLAALPPVALALGWLTWGQRATVRLSEEALFAARPESNE
jgi:hypothetical protein